MIIKDTHGGHEELFPEILNVNRITVFFRINGKFGYTKGCFMVSIEVHPSWVVLTTLMAPKIMIVSTQAWDGGMMNLIFWIVLCNNILSFTKGGMFLQTISQMHQ